MWHMWCRFHTCYEHSAVRLMTFQAILHIRSFCPSRKQFRGAVGDTRQEMLIKNGGGTTEKRQEKNDEERIIKILQASEIPRKQKQRKTRIEANRNKASTKKRQTKIVVRPG